MKSKEELLSEMNEAWNKTDSLQQCINVAERWAIEKQIEVLTSCSENYSIISKEIIDNKISELQTKLKSL